MGAMRRTMMAAVCSSLAATATICAPSAAQCDEVLGWTQLSNAGPSGRGRHSIAVDTVRNRAVLFGGIRELSGFQRPRDTWEWDGSQWTQVSSIGPAGRNDGAMAFHGAIGKVVLFGGNAPGLLGDTWTWDGAVWQQLSIPGPSARQFHAMAYDPIRAEIVLFGGWAPLTGDTWVFNGTSWSQRVVAGPGARLDAKMAWDPTRSAIILHGGNTDASACGQPLNDTWSWNGTSWAQVTATGGPGSCGFDMTFDSRVGGIVALRGDRTWLLQGSSWTEILPGNPSGLPSSRGNHVMWTDPETGAVNLHGGYPDLTDTWELIVEQGGYAVPDCFATIQAAIAAAPIGQATTIAVAPGTYSGPIDFLGKDIALVGAGVGQSIIDGNGGQVKSVVYVEGSPATARLEGFTIRNGTTGQGLPDDPASLCGGGLLAVNSAFTVRNCRFEDNYATYGGGAYFRYGSAKVENCEFVANVAASRGGGSDAFESSTSFTDCFYYDNRAAIGGGMQLVRGQHVVERTRVELNFAGSVGGGIHWFADVPTAALVLRDSEILDNNSKGNASGLSIFLAQSTAQTVLEGTVVCGNLPRNIDGGPYTADATSDVCDCRADVVFDGIVGAPDLSLVLGAWGPAAVGAAADINMDGIVNAADVSILLASWGACASE